MAKINALIEKIANGKNPLFQELYGVNEVVLKEQADRYAGLMNEFQKVYGIIFYHRFSCYPPAERSVFTTLGVDFVYVEYES